jgi:hypothetical protein
MKTELKKLTMLFKVEEEQCLSEISISVETSEEMKKKGDGRMAAVQKGTKGGCPARRKLWCYLTLLLRTEDGSGDGLGKHRLCICFLHVCSCIYEVWLSPLYPPGCLYRSYGGTRCRCPGPVRLLGRFLQPSIDHEAEFQVSMNLIKLYIKVYPQIS